MNLDQLTERVLGSMPEATRVRFAQDPKAVLREDFGLKLAPVADLGTSKRGDGGECDGVSFLDDGVVTYARTPNSRRENFTLAHEMGHLLADRDKVAYNWLANQSDPGRLLETLCDRVAQQLLLPASAVDPIVGSGPVRASHLTQLFDATNASRPVCAIAVAQRLGGLGVVCIIDPDTLQVTHASVRPDPEQGWPTVFPWRGQKVRPTHPLLQLRPGESRTLRVTWMMPWGTEADFYADSTADDRRIVAVLSDRNTWITEGFRPPLERDFDDRPKRTVRCCGAVTEARGYPCTTCHAGYCRTCGRCDCDRKAAREVRCEGCFVMFQPHLLVSGRCESCR